MILAINQPCFIPWFAYFDLIKNSQKLVFLDTVLSPKRSNSFIFRNRIYYREKLRWVTFPIDLYNRKKFLNEIEYTNENKIITLNKIVSYTSNDPYYNLVKKNILSCFEIENSKLLIDLSKDIIKKIISLLGLKIEILNSTDIIDFNYVIKKNISGGELVKLIVKELKPKKLYNFYNGVEKKIYPFGDYDFFNKQDCELYKQDIDKYLLNVNRNNILMQSALSVISQKGTDFLLKNLNLEYSLMNKII